MRSPKSGAISSDNPKIDGGQSRMAYFSHINQYDYTLTNAPVGLKSGDGRLVLAPSQPAVRSDDQFLLEHAGEMLRLLLAMIQVVDYPGNAAIQIPSATRAALDVFHRQAIVADIDTIGVSECSSTPP